jgi:hypothetical protein
MRFIFWDSSCVGRSCYLVSATFATFVACDRTRQLLLFQLPCCIASVRWYIVTCFLQRRTKIHVLHKTVHEIENVPEFVSCRSIWEQCDRDEIIISYYTYVLVFVCVCVCVCIYTVFTRIICALFFLVWPLKNRGAWNTRIFFVEVLIWVLF